MRYFISIGDKTYPPTRLVESPWCIYGHSRALFCTQCGEIWARWHVELIGDAIIQGKVWNMTYRTCPNHQFGAWTDDRPGSLTTHVADAVVLPRELLIRELFLNHQEKEYSDNEQSPS